MVLLVILLVTTITSVGWLAYADHSWYCKGGGAGIDSLVE